MMQPCLLHLHVISSVPLTRSDLALGSTNLSKEPFIVMMNAFPLEKGIAMHEVYDLKGSMHGREIKEKEKAEKVVIYKVSGAEGTQTTTIEKGTAP